MIFTVNNHINENDIHLQQKNNIAKILEEGIVDNISMQSQNPTREKL